MAFDGCYCVLRVWAGYFVFTQAWEKRKVREALTSPAECWLTHLCNGDSSLWADGV